MNLTTPSPLFTGSPDDVLYSPRTESEPENDTGYELENHTWQFPSSEVARMLSPKKPKAGVEAIDRLLLDQYDCVADELIFQDTLNDAISRLKSDNESARQSLDHHDLVVFFTRCVETCHDALDDQQSAPLRQDRWFQGLGFTVGGVLATSSGESVPFRLDIADGHGLSPLGDKALCWTPLGDESARRVALLVETDGSWKKTVSQATDSARRLFGASQVRSFVLVLAFNRDSKALRFLIFHHGGITASEPCNITEPGGLKEVVRIFLALAFWSTPVGAGFIPSFAGTEYALPADRFGKTYRLAVVDDVLSRSLRVRGRMTLVSRLRLLQDTPADGDSSNVMFDRRVDYLEDKPAVNLPEARRHEADYVQPKKIFRSDSDPILSDMVGTIVVKTSWQEIGRRGNEAEMHSASGGRFGTTPHMCSYEGVGEHREAMSNILFLPRQEDIAKRHWPVFSGDLPSEPDLRTLWITVFGVVGQSLVKSKSPRQLSRAWVHSMLGVFVTTF